eukprot:146128-Prymnesium_polylepis.2
MVRPTTVLPSSTETDTVVHAAARRGARSSTNAESAARAAIRSDGATHTVRRRDRPWPVSSLSRHMPWSSVALGVAPLLVWLLSRTLLVQPAEVQLHSAQQALLAAEHAELEGLIALRRTRAAASEMERRSEALSADASRLRAAESAALRQIAALDEAAKQRERDGLAAT